MQINQINNSNQTFNGAFRIRPSETIAKEEIPQLFSQGRQIFNNILEQGDKFIVVRDRYDARVSRYIRETNLNNVEYYPEINTKSGLDDQEPEGLLKLIKTAVTKMYTDAQDISDISAQISTQAKKEAKIKQERKEIQPVNILNRVADALRLNIEKPKIITTTKSTVIRDENKQRTIEVITPDPRTSYVYVRPDKPWEDSIRCIIDKQGNVIKRFETPKDIMKFLKKFNQLKVNNENLTTNSIS